MRRLKRWSPVKVDAWAEWYDDGSAKLVSESWFRKSPRARLWARRLKKLDAEIKRPVLGAGSPPDTSEEPPPTT